MVGTRLEHTRLRDKGQITLPGLIRNYLHVDSGDEIIFDIDENGKVYLSKAQIIPADQAWFWTERWQEMEREAQAEINSGRTNRYDSVEKLFASLESLEDAKD